MSDQNNDKPTKKRFAARIFRTFILFAVIISCLAICITVYAKHKVEDKAEEIVSMVQPVDKTEVKEMINENLDEETLLNLKDNWTIALFGIDSRDENNLDSANSDVIMIGTLDHETGGIRLVSVYRDTCLKIGNKTYRKANAAYASGGPKAAVKMLNENLDLEIDDYVAVNWKSVADAINILGGIDLEISKAEFRYINAFITETVKSTGVPSVQLKVPGMQHLDGVQAVAYARLRLMDDDFKRTERQRKVLELVLQKARSADFAALQSLVYAVLPETASSIDKDDIGILIKNILKIHLEETSGFPFTHYEKTVGGAAYVFPEDLAENVSMLHKFLYGTAEYVTSENVQKISDAISRKGGRKSYRTKASPSYPQRSR